MEKASSSSSRTTTVLACAAACLFTCVATLLIAKQFGAPTLCARSYDVPRIAFPKEESEWDSVHRLNIDEYNVTAMITDGSERCYLQPLNRDGVRRALQLVPEPLSEEMIEAIGGVSAAHFCDGLPTYLLRDLDEVRVNHAERARRQANIPEDLTWGGELEYDQRTPRCMDIVLDCGLDSNIGQSQKCFTWINGVILMKQQCDSPTQFSIYMTKPPQRILKLAQRQMKECLLRRQKGLRC